jgi:hypothetical protein
LGFGHRLNHEDTSDFLVPQCGNVENIHSRQISTDTKSVLTYLRIGRDQGLAETGAQRMRLRIVST